MKYSHKLSDAVHILAYIDVFPDGNLSSNAIAQSVESNPSLIRRLMSLLVKADILTSQPGTVAPKITKPTDQITLLDIYNAIDDDHNLLHVDDKTNPACIVGGNIQDTLNVVYQDIQKQAEVGMQKVTLASIVEDILERNKQRSIE